MMEIELTLTGQVSALHEWVGGTSPWRVAYVALSTCVCVCVCVLSHWAHEAVDEVPDLISLKCSPHRSLAWYPASADSICLFIVFILPRAVHEQRPETPGVHRAQINSGSPEVLTFGLDQEFHFGSMMSHSNSICSIFVHLP
jgi:hypothetical protein